MTASATIVVGTATAFRTASAFGTASATSSALMGMQGLNLLLGSVPDTQNLAFEKQVFSCHGMIEINPHLLFTDRQNLSPQAATKAVHHRQYVANHHIVCIHLFEYIFGQIDNHILVHLAIGLGGRNMKIKLISLLFLQQIQLKILQRLPLSAPAVSSSSPSFSVLNS